MRLKAKGAASSSRLLAQRAEALTRPEAMGSPDGGMRQMFGTSGELMTTFEAELDQLVPRPDQPRQIFDEEDLRRLAENMRQRRQLQPILVRTAADRDMPDGRRRYEIVAGERRWRAAQLAGKSRVACMLLPEGEDPDELALIENMVRADLKPLEEAIAFRRLLDRGTYSQEDLGALVGRSLTQINNALALLRLPAAVQADLLTGQYDVARSALLEISREPKPERQLAMWEKAKAGLAGTLELRADRAGRGKKPVTAKAFFTGLRSLNKRFDKAFSDVGPGQLDKKQEAAVRDMVARLKRLLGED